jgi:hypothetical protein
MLAEPWVNEAHADLMVGHPTQKTAGALSTVMPNWKTKWLGQAMPQIICGIIHRIIGPVNIQLVSILRLTLPSSSM